MVSIKELTEEILQGREVSRSEALALYALPLEELCEYADKIRRHFCADSFDLCTIINGKSGKCSENCRFCAQSAHNHTGSSEYPLLSANELVAQAKKDDARGVLRYSVVTSGKRLSDAEIDSLCLAIRRIKAETKLSVCVSVGLLDEGQFRKLKEAGVCRAHNNLETSWRNCPNICTTHTFDDKVNAIRAAQAAGLTVCSGGIMGLGETVEDRIDMAFSLRELGVQSVPVNMLNPIPGTPLAEMEPLGTEEMRRIVAVYRFILPRAFIRLAGGRGLMEDMGQSCFVSGANAAISGDMLTTAGITVETDMQMVRELGFCVSLPL